MLASTKRCMRQADRRLELAIPTEGAPAILDGEAR
jgi:hypothetical protein